MFLFLSYFIYTYKSLNYFFLKGTVLLESTTKIKIDCIALNESIIRLRFAINRIKISLLEPEIQPAKGARSHYAGPMTSRDVISLQPATISLVTLHNRFLTVEDYTKATQVISDTHLPCRRCESWMFVI